MKKIALLICLPIFLISGELVDALLQSKKNNKPIMVYVKSESCQFCKKMKDETLNSSLIQNNMKNFIFVTTDKTSEEAQKYLPKTRYTPTVYFIAYKNSKFKAVNVVKGYLGKEDFNLWIEDTKNKLGINETSVDNSVNVVTEEETPKSGNWMYDIASGMDYAAQTGKQLMVYVETANTKWCQQMEDETLTNSSVIDALDDFVLVKVQKDSDEAKAFGLKPMLTPTSYFMKADGSSLATAEGYFGADDFLLWIKHAKHQLTK